jgi:thioredoxin 1
LNPNVNEFTTQNWEAEVLKSGEPVLVDFWAEWCAPCRMIAPFIDAVATEFAGRIKVGKLNVDEQGEIAMKYGIRSIPTLLVFKNGQVAEQRVGALSKTDLATLVTKHSGTAVASR